MKSLYKACIELGPEADSEEVVYLFAESALYVLGATGAFDFQRHIRHLCGTKSAKVYRLSLCSHVYTNLSIKLYLVHLAIANPSPHLAQKLADRYEISNRDAKLLRWLLINNDWFRKLVLRSVKSKSYRVEDLSHSAIHGTFNRVFPSVLKYIKHVTYTKLRFLVKSTNSDFQDYHSELSAKIVQEFYSMMPNSMGDAHLTNYLKRIVHNHAINMIKSGTTQKRGRLTSTVEDSSGNRKFSMLCLSQNQMPLSELGEAADVGGKDDSAGLFELRFSISEVLDTVKANSRKYRFLTLLLGAEDKEFSEWLRASGVCGQSEDNVDVQHRTTPDRYTELLSSFLKVSGSSVSSFFASLKHQLAW